MSNLQSIKTIKYVKNLIQFAKNRNGVVVGKYIWDAVLPPFLNKKIVIDQIDLWFKEEVNIDHFNHLNDCKLVKYNDGLYLVKYNTKLIKVHLIIKDVFFPHDDFDFNNITFDGEFFDYYTFNNEVNQFTSTSMTLTELSQTPYFERLMTKKTIMSEAFLQRLLNSYIPTSKELVLLNDLAIKGWRVWYKNISFPMFTTFDWIKTQFDCNKNIDLIYNLDLTFLLKFLDENPSIGQQFKCLKTTLGKMDPDAPVAHACYTIGLDGRPYVQRTVNSIF